jgi:hypothetical protein
MSEILIVKPLDPQPATAVAVAQPAPTRLQKVSQYLRRHAGFFAFAFLFLTLFYAVSPAAAAGVQTGPPAELGDWIIQGLETGMDIIWGMSPIVIVLMIPAGLGFAMGIIKGIVGMFQGFRF